MSVKKSFSVCIVSILLAIGFIQNAYANTPPNFDVRIKRGGDNFTQVSVSFPDYTGASVAEYSSVDANGDDIPGAEFLCRNSACNNQSEATDTLEVIVSGLKSDTQWTVAYESITPSGSPDPSDHANYPSISGTGNGTFTQNHRGDASGTYFYIRVEKNALVFENATPALASKSVSQATVDVDVDIVSNVYAVMVPSNDSAPNASQIIAGQNASSAVATASASVSLSNSDVSGQVIFSGLTAVVNKDFNIYLVAQDELGYQSEIPAPLSISFDDTDNDGILNEADPDDDGDGVPDANDNSPYYTAQSMPTVMACPITLT